MTNLSSKLIKGLDESEVLSEGTTKARSLNERFADSLNVKDFGELGVDDAAVLTLAVEKAKETGKRLVLSKGDELNLHSSVEIREVDTQFDGTIYIHFTDEVGVIIGGSANSRNNPKQVFNTITYPSSLGWDGSRPNFPVVQARGVKGQELHVWNTPRFELFADRSGTSQEILKDYSCAYSRVYLGYVKYAGVDSITTSEGFGWVNELDIYLTSCSYFSIDSNTTDGSEPYRHNNIRVHGGTFEGDGHNGNNIEIIYGNSNHFYDIRLESAEGVRFGENTRFNSVSVSWVSAGIIGSSLVNEDSGEGNLYRVKGQTGVVCQTLVSVTSENYQDRIKGLSPENLSISGGGLLEVPAWRYIYETDYLPVNTRANSCNFSVRTALEGLEDSSAQGIRAEVRGYDKYFNEVTGSSDEDFLWVGGRAISWGTSQSSHGANVQEAYGSVTRKGIEKVEYIKVFIRNGNVTSRFARATLEVQVPKALLDSVDLPPCNEKIPSPKAWLLKPLIPSATVSAHTTVRESFSIPSEITGVSDDTHFISVSTDPSTSVDGFSLDAVITGSDTFEVICTNIKDVDNNIPSNFRVRALLREVETSFNV